MSMEPIAHVIAKRDSFKHLWKLLAPKTEYADLYVPCMRRWNGFSYRRQQQIYWYLREKKRKGEKLYENPLHAINYCYPKPYDWNGKFGLDEMLKKHKMVRAYYNGEYGIYEQKVAEIFEMTHVEACE